MVNRTSPARTPQELDELIAGGIGDSPLRPDGTLKVRGEYAYSSDLWIDIGPALEHPGVYAVLTHEDVPGENIYGLKVAADHPETARRTMEKIVVAYEVVEPITDPERAAHDDGLPKSHPEGNAVRYQPIIRGNPISATPAIVNAIRNATGMNFTHTPVSPEHICGDRQ